MPMSASVLVNREEFLELLEESIATLPQELRHSRWLLKEREEFLSQARREADDIIEAGRVPARRVVGRPQGGGAGPPAAPPAGAAPRRPGRPPPPQAPGPLAQQTAPLLGGAQPT